MDVEALHREAKSKYWNERSLPETRRLLEQGIALARSEERPDLEKPLQYDLASFCWPGWDEPGIAPTADDVSAGEAAAARNLDLARELDRPAIPMGNAWWMVGAYALAREQCGRAAEAFAMCHELHSDHPTQALLAEGYLALANGRETVAWPTILSRLREHGDEGEEFATQLETAARVFAR